MFILARAMIVLYVRGPEEHDNRLSRDKLR